jgi:hypothetical protein
MFSVRKMDHTEELRNMLDVIYEIYDAAGITYERETL